MWHLDLERAPPVSTFRRIAIGTWRTAYDPSIYGTIEVRVDAALDYLARFRAATGRRLTVNHLVARVAGSVLREVPESNRVLRFNRPYQRTRANVFFMAVIRDEKTGKVDLSGVTLHDVDRKSLLEILDEFESTVGEVRSGKLTNLEKTRRRFHLVPYFLLNAYMSLIALLAYKFNLNMTWAGLPRDAFGGMMISNIGTLGLDVGYVPLVPYTHTPIVVSLGAIKEGVRWEGDSPRKIHTMNFNATFDHRLIDGHHISEIVNVVRTWFGDPDRYFGPIPSGKSAP